MKFINENIKDIHRLCYKYYVYDLYVFDSMTKDKSSENSIINFSVKFEGGNASESSDNFMNFENELKNILSRDINLVDTQNLKDQALKALISKNKIYGKADTQILI